MQLQTRLGIGLQGAHHHGRAKVAATDADVNHIGDAALGLGAHALGKSQHGRQRALHLIAEQALARWGAQGRVQHGAAFGQIDGRAGKQRLAL